MMPEEDIFTRVALPRPNLLESRSYDGIEFPVSLQKRLSRMTPLSAY